VRLQRHRGRLPVVHRTLTFRACFEPGNDASRTSVSTPHLRARRLGQVGPRGDILGQRTSALTHRWRLTK
jgi:hypothetical protein